MKSGIRSKVFGSSEKKPSGRGESSAMFRMIGVGVLKLEVYKTASQLNKSLVEGVIMGFRAAPEPELLKHIVRFVIVLGIEALKVTEITRVKMSTLIQIE